MSLETEAQGVKLWTPANIITVVRICLVPVFVLALLSPWPEWFGLSWMSIETKSLIAAGVFIIISCTDWIDGYLARSRNEVTDFGKFMDPLADKILVAAALLALIELDVLPSWPVLIILVREFIVSGIRMIAATEGEVIAASWYGKAKTVFQILAIILFIVKDSLLFTTVSSAMHNPLYVMSWVVMVIALVLTIVSMLDYLSKARHLLGFSAKSAVNKQQEPLCATRNESLAPAEREDKTARELAVEVIERAGARGIVVATAESLTGGLITAELTSIPGSSAVVAGGIVSYSNDVKSNMLDVDAAHLCEHGAVNEATALQMARGARERFGADIAVSVTGIAGPGGSEPGKPVGTVCIGVCTSVDTFALTKQFAGDRTAVREQTVHQALALMLEQINR